VPHGRINGRPNRDSTWLARVDEYLALPDHPEYNASEDHNWDEAFKDGTWRNDDMVDMADALHWKFKRTRGVVHPEPGEDYSYDEWKAGRSLKQRRNGYGYQKEVLRHEYYQVNLEKEFRDQGLQVIVKLASVELTPEKPEYSGGNWHLEVRRIWHSISTHPRERH
jgi:hypothetical protein